MKMDKNECKWKKMKREKWKMEQIENKCNWNRMKIERKEKKKV